MSRGACLKGGFIQPGRLVLLIPNVSQGQHTRIKHLTLTSAPGVHLGAIGTVFSVRLSSRLAAVPPEARAMRARDSIHLGESSGQLRTGSQVRN